MSAQQTTIIPQSKVSDLFNKHGLNSKITEKVNDLNAKIDLIRKHGGPVKPVAPVPPKQPKKSDTDQAAKDKYAEDHAQYKLEHDKYEAALKEYNAYNSAEFTRLDTLNRLVKNLNRLVSHLMATGEMTETRKKEIANIRFKLNDEKRAMRVGESADSYKKYVEKWKPRGFKALLGSLNLENPEKLNEFMNQIKSDKANVNLQLFLDKDEINKDRKKIGSHVAFTGASVSEAICAEIIETGMRNLTYDDDDSRGNTLRPDNCVGSDSDQNDLYHLYASTRSYRALGAKNARHEQYKHRRSAAQSEHNAKYNQVRENNKFLGQDTTERKFAYDSFEETEVKNGHAVRVVKLVKGNPEAKDEANRKDHEVVRYVWKHIDEQLSDADADFTNYVAQLAEVVRDKNRQNFRYANVKLSKSVKIWVSRVLTDVLVTLREQIGRMTRRSEGIIKEDVIPTIIEVVLCQHYNGDFPLGVDVLLSNISVKVKQNKEYNKTKKTEKAVAKANGHESVTSVTNPPVATTTAAPAAKTPVRVGKV